MLVLMLDENAYVNYHLLIVKCTGHAKEWPAKNGDDDVNDDDNYTMIHNL